jgi:hypothetical protein
MLALKKTLTACCIWVLVGTHNLCFADDREEAASLLEAYMTNLRAINRFDVSIKFESLAFDDEKQATVEFGSKERLIVDRPNGRCLYVTFAEKRVSGLEADENEGSAKIHAAVLSEDGGFLRDVPKSIAPIGKTTITSVLNRQTAPELRLIGVTKFPFPVMDGSVYKAAFTSAITPAANAKVALVGENAVRATVTYETRGADNRMTWVFDTDTNMPISARSTTMPGPDDTWKPKPDFVETYEWTSISGIYVPKSITGERRFPIRKAEGRSVFTNMTYDVSFQWKSVNSDLDKSLFAKEKIADDQTLRELTFLEAKGDPEATK